jgi:branched-chain amino acid transport system substrate-binding protein
LRQLIAIAISFALAAVPAWAAEPLKVGFISTLSGSHGITGQELLDGFKLGIKEAGGTLGGRPVKLIIGDDDGKPGTGLQVAEKMLEQDKVQLVTGIVLSNVILAAAKPILESKTFLVSINAGPALLAGKQCSPYFFNVSSETDSPAEAMGQYMTDAKVERVYLMAPNYPAGKETMAGFKRFYKGKIVGEVLTGMKQLDFAAQLTQLKAAKPDAVFYFYNSGTGINFLKQYRQAGLKGEIPLYATEVSVDSSVTAAAGDAAIGIRDSAYWSESFDNPANHAFVKAFEAEYHRAPSLFAANAYDGARLIDAALKSINGKIEDKAAFRKALEAAKFQSVRGNFRFGKNHFPVQDYRLFEIAKDSSGKFINKYVKTIMTDHGDAYVGECHMK